MMSDGLLTRWDSISRRLRVSTYDLLPYVPWSFHPEASWQKGICGTVDLYFVSSSKSQNTMKKRDNMSYLLSSIVYPRPHLPVVRSSWSAGWSGLSCTREGVSIGAPVRNRWKLRDWNCQTHCPRHPFPGPLWVFGKFFESCRLSFQSGGWWRALEPLRRA